MSIPIKYPLSIYLSSLFGQEGWVFWPGSFLRFYAPRGSRDQKKRKKERGQYPTIFTEQDWTLKDWLYGQEAEEEKLSLRNKRGKSRAGKMGPFFPLR